MRSVFSYLITMLVAMFWILRIVVTLTYSMSVNFPITPLNFNVEVVLLFVTLVCFIFIIKRNIIGALIYFLAYGFYFGADLYNNVINIINGQVATASYLSIFVSFFGILIPFLIVIDIFLNKDGSNAKDKKTDWFYANEEYTRKLDERADKNQYKF